MTEDRTPWPLALAFGLAVAELGVFLGFAVVAAPGMVLFGASLAGAISEAGYGRSRPYLLVVVAGALVAFGALLLAAGFPLRGYATLAGALLLLPLSAVDARS